MTILRRAFAVLLLPVFAPFWVIGMFGGLFVWTWLAYIFTGECGDPGAPVLTVQYAWLELAGWESDDYHDLRSFIAIPRM